MNNEFFKQVIDYCTEHCTEAEIDVLIGDLQMISNNKFTEHLDKLK